MKPKISIITGVYQSEAYLPRYFAMLRAQSFRDWEAILVDDGSQDGTAAMIQEMAARDPRFRYFRKDPEGYPSRSRAFGLQVAEAELLAFCDHDDFWAPDKLQWQWQTIQAHPEIAILHTDRVVWASLAYPDAFPAQPDFSARYLVWQKPEEVIYRGLRIIFSSFLGHKSQIASIGFHPDMKGVDDFYLFVRLAQLGPIVQIALPQTYYYAHSSNLSHAHNIFVKGFYQVWQTLKADQMPPKVLRSIEAQALRTHAVSLFGTDSRRAFYLLCQSLQRYFMATTLNRLLYLIATMILPLSWQARFIAWVKVWKFRFPTLKDLFSLRRD